MDLDARNDDDPVTTQSDDGVRIPRTILIAAAVVAVLLVALAGYGLFGGDDDTAGTTTGTTIASSAAKNLEEGLAAQLAGDVATALEKYEAVLDEDPKNTPAIYNIGVIQHQQGDLEGAEHQYRAALVIDPDFTSALFNLAILRTEEAPTEALDLYRHVLSVDDGNAGAHLNIGFLLLDLGRADEAQVEFAAAVEIDPALASRIPTTTVPAESTTTAP